MGYFSNGTEGMMYEEKYCSRCVHWKPDGPGCMVWLAHLMHNHEGGPAQKVLNLLIPPAKDGLGNDQCSMFFEQQDRRCPDTREMF